MPRDITAIIKEYYDTEMINLGGKMILPGKLGMKKALEIAQEIGERNRIPIVEIGFYSFVVCISSEKYRLCWYYEDNSGKENCLSDIEVWHFSSHKIAVG